MLSNWLAVWLVQLGASKETKMTYPMMWDQVSIIYCIADIIIRSRNGDRLAYISWRVVYFS